jgi:hypothetical protein
MRDVTTGVFAVFRRRGWPSTLLVAGTRQEARLMTVEELAEHEHDIVSAIEAGELVDLRVGEPRDDDPARGAVWGAARTVPARLLVELLTAALPPDSGRPRPVRVRGARITGSLDLEACTLTCPLLLQDCHLEEVVNLDEAAALMIRLPGCHLPGLTAQQLRTSGNLELNDGFTVEGKVDLLGAHIGGKLSFSGARLTNPGGITLNADRLSVEQGLFCRDGFIAEGEVRLLGAQVGGQLDLNGARLINPGGKALQVNWLSVGQYMLCSDGFTADGAISMASARVAHLDLSGATLANEGGRALDCDGITVERDIVCSGFTARGEVSLSGARVAGHLILDGARLANPGGRALYADALTVGQSLFCRNGLTAEGEIRLNGARIGGVCNLTGAQLSNPGGRAFYAVRFSVDGDLLCRKGFTAQGEVNLDGARIGGQVELDEARLINPGGNALMADQLSVDQMFSAQRLTTEGVLRLTRAHIGGVLSLSGAHLINPGGNALAAEGLTVDRSVFCGEGFTAQGGIHLANAHLGGHLDLRGASLNNSEGLALDLEGSCVAHLLLRPAHAPTGGIDLANAQVGVFDDDQATWPPTLLLRGFTYETLANDQVSARDRLRWLTRSPGGYTPQIYDQLAAAYRRDGREEAARHVAIAKQWHRRKMLNPIGKLTNWLLYLTVGYGYRTWLAAIWLAGLLTIGTWEFSNAYPHHMARAEPKGPAFHAMAYTLDLLLPIVDLGQRKAWQPQGTATYWSWALIAAGWVLTTAVVAGLTGIIKRP